jgi:hypothetical protein
MIFRRWIEQTQPAGYSSEWNGTTLSEHQPNGPFEPGTRMRLNAVSKASSFDDSGVL